MAAGHQFQQRERFITELPFGVLNKVHNTLDLGQGWLKLAEGLGYSFEETEGFAQAKQRADGSPTKDLLLDWGHKNPTVSDLYRNLIANKLNHAASYLKDYIGVQQSRQPIRRIQAHEVPLGTHQEQYTGNQTPVLGSGITRTTASFANSGAVQNIQNIPPPVPPEETDGPFVPTQGRVDHPQTSVMHNSYGCNTVMQNQIQHVPPKPVPEKFDSEGYITSMSSDGMRMSQTGSHGGIQVLPGKMSHEQHRLYPNKGGEYDATNRSPDVTGSSTMKATQHDPASWSEVSSSYPLTTVSSQTDDEASLRSTLSISYTGIQRATNNFDQRRVIGNGGFGSVYLGEIARTQMAIKVLKDRETFKNPGEKYQHYLAEIRALTRFRHPNIVTLSGYCIEGPRLCLIYEYMVNGSLEDLLTCKNNRQPLPWWPYRYNILTDAARGLQYLHCAEEKPYVHGDIKSANILLDDHLRAKIADFNLTKEATGISDTGKYTHITKAQMTEALYGSKAYLPKEFFQTDGRFSISTDVFSFGMVIYEVCVGVKALDNDRKPKPYLRDLIEEMLDNDEETVVHLKDPKMPNWSLGLWRKLFDLGRQCTNRIKKKRPKMEEVLVCLERLIIDVQVQGDKGTDMNKNEVPHRKHPGLSLDSVPPLSQTSSGPASQKTQQAIIAQHRQNRVAVPREQTDGMNEGPSMLQIIQSSGRASLSSNDPSLRMWDPPKKGQYALQGSMNVSYLANSSSMESAGTMNTNDRMTSGSSTSTDIYTANDRCVSTPEMILRQQQVHVPNTSQRGQSLPYHVLHQPIPSSGTGLTEFYNAEPFQLQLQHDARSAGPASLASQPKSLHLAQHNYVNFPLPQNNQNPNQCEQPMSMPSYASTEEINNEKTEELESLAVENLGLERTPEVLESAKIIDMGRKMPFVCDGPVDSSSSSKVSDTSSCIVVTSPPSDTGERSRALANTLRDDQTNVSEARSTSGDLRGTFVPKSTESGHLRQKQPRSSLPVMSTAVSPPPRHGESAPPSLVPYTSTPTMTTSPLLNPPFQGNVPQEISPDKIVKAGLLPMPVETGDTGEICESDLKDIDIYKTNE